MPTLDANDTAKNAKRHRVMQPQMRQRGMEKMEVRGN